MIINLWESEEDMQKASAVISPKAQEAGLAEPVDWHQYEFVQHETHRG